MRALQSRDRPRAILMLLPGVESGFPIMLQY